MGRESSSLKQADLQTALGDDGRNTVRLVLHEKNMGKGAGVRSGLANSTGDLVLIQDADLEYDPGDYPALMKPILEGHADAVFGNRFHSGSHRVQRYYRYKLNRAFSVVCNLLTGITIHDVTACYKVFKRDLLERMHLRSDRFSVETEMAVKVAKLSARIYESSYRVSRPHLCRRQEDQLERRVGCALRSRALSLRRLNP